MTADFDKVDRNWAHFRHEARNFLITASGSATSAEVLTMDPLHHTQVFVPADRARTWGIDAVMFCCGTEEEISVTHGVFTQPPRVIFAQGDPTLPLVRHLVRVVDHQFKCRKR